MALTYDLSTNAKWAILAGGTHNITIVAKADGYRDSEPSAAVSVTKQLVTDVEENGNILIIKQANATQNGTEVIIE